MEGHITITRKTEGQDLYSRLQEKALKDIQRIAGKVWTDYNLHDPGITLLDVLNYVLVETDYRMGFTLPDYLTLPQKEFIPREHALFAPSEIYPVNPVTVTDYRKLFISNIDDLSDVRVIVHPESGTYDFVLDVWPDTTDARRKRILKEVFNLYHAHRNLCENVGMIRFLEYDILQICAEIEIDDTMDSNMLTARIFFEIQEFLRAGVRFRRVDELLAEGWTPDEILEGPEQGRMVVDNDSLCTDWEEYDVAWLYQRLRDLQGVSRISSFYFKEDGNVIHGNLKRKSIFQGYALAEMGYRKHEISLTRRGRSVLILWDAVQLHFGSMRAALYGAQNRTTDKEVLDAVPIGIHRDVFSHYSLRNDLPGCYRENIGKQAGAYLDIFDRLTEYALDELKSLPYWMKPDETDLSAKKEQWIDVLEGIYGEDSNLPFLWKYEDETERRRRRVAFLESIPLWGLNRGRGMNLLDTAQQDEAGIEAYFKKVLNIEKFQMEFFLLEYRFLEYKNSEFAVTEGDVSRIAVVLAVDEKWLLDGDFRHGCGELLNRRLPAHIQMTLFWQRRGQIAAFRSNYLFWKYSLSTQRKYGLEELCGKLKKDLKDDNNWYSKI